MSLMRQIGGLGAANIIFLLSQLGVLALLTNLTDLETVAAFGFVMGVTQPLYMLLLMGLRANLATDARKDFAFATFLSLRALASVSLFATVIAVIAAVRPAYLPLALPIALMKAVEMQSDLCYGALQRAGRIRHVALSMFARGPAALALFGTILALTGDARIAFWAQTVVWLAIQALHDFPAVRRAGETLALDRSLSRITALARNTALLGLGQFFASLQVNLPRFFVEMILGPAALALFTAVSVLQRATVSLFNTIEQAIGWRLSRRWVAGERGKFFAAIRKMLAAATGIAALGIVLAALIGKPFLGLVFGPDYTAAYGLLLWMAAAIGAQLLVSVMQTALTAQRRFSAFGAVQFAVLLATVPAAWAGIQFFGLEGAGMAILATTLLRMSIFAVILLRS